MTDERVLYRVCITYRPMKRNPEWDAAPWDAPFYVPDPDAEPYVAYYGPYKSAATARAQGSVARRECVGEEVVSVVVQRTEIEWEDMA